MTRKLRPAAELVSDIGSLAFTLRHHSTADIAEAVTFLRTVNPEMFDWLARLLAAQASPPTPDAEIAKILKGLLAIPGVREAAAQSAFGSIVYVADEALLAEGAVSAAPPALEQKTSEKTTKI